VSLKNLWTSLETSSVGSFVAESAWAFPTIESVHVIALVTVVGTIAVMDLRLLGWVGRQTRVTSISSDTLPWTWGAFVLAAITGSLLFVSKAGTYAANPYFRLKLVFLVLAGLNMALFHFTTWKTVHQWDEDERAIPTAGKVAGALSLIFWICVVFFGRAIGFTLGLFEG